MRSRFLLLSCVVPVLAGILFGGCKRQLANPTFPPTMTATAGPSSTFTHTRTHTPVFTSTVTASFTWTHTRTITSTPTNTSTPVNTSTPSNTSTPANTDTPTSTATITDTATVTSTPTVTSTVTNTPTLGGPTDTPTLTSTPSPTSTVTASPTPTLTATSTATPAATNTPTLTQTATDTPNVSCPVALAAPYTFDSSIGCWTTSNQLTNTTVDWATGPAGSASGGGAFHASVSYSASAQLTEEFEVPLPAGTDLTNKIISMRVYIDNAVQGTAWGGGIQPYIKSGASSTFCNKSWSNISGFGAWYKYTMDLSTVCASGASDVRAIGVQIIIASGGGTGSIYIDDVTITDQPTVTPTATVTDTPGGPTSTPTATFACPLPAASAYNFDSNIGCWITNNQLTNTVLQWASGPVGSTSGGGALQAAVSYSASTQLTEELELPLPAGTDLTGKLLSMNLYIDNSVKGTAWGGGIQTYIKYGSSTTFCNKSWVNISGFGDWYPYTMDLSTLCTAGVTDVRAIGIQVIVANGGSTGYMYLDDVTIQ